MRWRSTDPDRLDVTFRESYRPFGDSLLDLRVEVAGPELRSAAWVRTLDGDGLDTFLRGLADDFRGWAGRREWRSFEGVLSVDAEHRGHRVLLEVGVTGVEDTGAWSRVSVGLLVAPGEEMDAIARRTAALLDHRA